LKILWVKLTKIHKTVSDLSVQLSEQISRAIEIDETETRKLYHLTSHILRKSGKSRIESKPFGTAIEMGILYFFNKKKLEKRVRTYKDKKQYLENSLDDAIKRIQKTNAKKLFEVIEMNMKYGPEKTIDYIMESVAKTESIEINGMTLLEGTVRKVHNGKCREI